MNGLLAQNSLNSFSIDGVKDYLSILKQSNYVVEDGEVVLPNDLVEILLDGKVRTTQTGINAVMSSDTQVVASNLSYYKIVSIDATRSLIIYYGGYAVVVTIDDSGNPTFGNTLNFDSNCSYHDVDMLDSNHAIVFYEGASSYPRAIILTISGTTISAGTSVVVYSGSPTASPPDFSVVHLTSTSAIVLYSAQSSTTSANVLTISGTTITVGTKYDVSTIGEYFCTLTRISATAVIKNNPRQTGFNILTISGTTITTGANFNSGSDINECASSYVAINSNMFIGINSPGQYGKAIVTLYSFTGTTSTVLGLYQITNLISASYAVYSKVYTCLVYPNKVAFILYIASGCLLGFVTVNVNTNKLKVSNLISLGYVLNPKFTKSDLDTPNCASLMFLSTDTISPNYLKARGIVLKKNANGIAKTGGTGGQIIQVYSFS